MSWPSFLPPPQSRDWPEDAAADDDNGCYNCTCIVCKVVFIGHKRRMICKNCASEDSAEAKRRAEWLHLHKAPSDWIVLTNAEVQAIKADLVNQTWALSEAQREVKRLRTALERIATCTDAPAIDTEGEWRTGLHCGVEDRDCCDRYEGADYGHAVGVEKALEWASGEAKSVLGIDEGKPSLTSAPAT